ncbi:hypothetical protein OFC37_34540, partial [Escherichia coli]|nr:hypothetical protein [Escherichia coli]
VKRISAEIYTRLDRTEAGPVFCRKLCSRRRDSSEPPVICDDSKTLLQLASLCRIMIFGKKNRRQLPV